MSVIHSWSRGFIVSNSQLITLRLLSTHHIVSNSQLITLRLLSTHHMWVNSQRNPRFGEKRLLIVTKQNHCLILLISFFEVKKLYRKMASIIICKEFPFLNLDTLKSSDFIGYTYSRNDLSKCFKNDHYKDASWPAGDEWIFITAWSAVGYP